MWVWNRIKRETEEAKRGIKVIKYWDWKVQGETKDNKLWPLKRPVRQDLKEYAFSICWVIVTMTSEDMKNDVLEKGS